MKLIMMEQRCKWHKGFKPCVAVVTLMFAILVFFSDSSWGGTKIPNRSDRFQDKQTYGLSVSSRHPGGYILLEKYWSDAPSHGRGIHLLLSKNYRNRYDRLSPEEKTMLRRRYREWESLPEEKQQMLRRRMKKYEDMPPQERERYRHRYRQLKKLPPDERYMIREKLRNWDNLSPDEQEQIRQRFRKP